MKKKGKYFLLGFIIIILSIGITYAYLYIVASSSNLTGKVETINVNLTSGSSVVATNLIPSSEGVVNAAYEKTGSDQCKDSDGLQVCTVYTFTVTNSTASGNLSISGNLVGTSNSFSNLKYKVYKTSGSVTGTLTSSMTSVPVTSGSSALFTNMVFSTDTSATFDIVLWLNETNTNQNNDMSKSFSGYVNITNDSGLTAVYD